MRNSVGGLMAAAVLALGGLLFQARALGHHSVGGEFDTDATIELRGTLTRLDWANPHLWYYLDVVEEDGTVEKWQCTTGLNPNRLVRSGWRKTDLPIGSKIHIAQASPARDGSNTCIVRGGLAFDDGTPVFSGIKE